MDRTAMIEDFKKFLEDNPNVIHDHMIHAEDLPADDDWLDDAEWDAIYAQWKGKRNE